MSTDLYQKENQIGRLPRLKWKSSFGNAVDETGERDAMEEVVQKDLYWRVVLQ